MQTSADFLDPLGASAIGFTCCPKLPGVNWAFDTTGNWPVQIIPLQADQSGTLPSGSYDRAIYDLV